jgi:hypothetical protein
MNPNPTGTKKSTVFSKPVPKIPGLSAPVTAVDLLADATITEPSVVVCELFHQGTKVVIASVSKGGKTILAFDLAASVATGSKFLHWDTVKGKVLFINFEIQPGFMKTRLKKLMARRQIDPSENLVVWNVRGKSADFPALLENIIQFAKGKGFVLIIFDPIYKAMVGKADGRLLVWRQVPIRPQQLRPDLPSRFHELVEVLLNRLLLDPNQPVIANLIADELDPWNRAGTILTTPAIRLFGFAVPKLLTVLLH